MQRRLVGQAKETGFPRFATNIHIASQKLMAHVAFLGSTSGLAMSAPTPTRRPSHRVAKRRRIVEVDLL